MARSLQIEDVKRSDLLRVWPQDIIVDPTERGRKFPPTQERVEEIGTSIGLQGQEQPAEVTVTHDKRLKLYAGGTRWEGIMWWNAQHPDAPIRIECVVKDRTPKEAFLSNIRENRIRNVTTCIDDAHNVRRLAEQFGYTDDDIRAEYGSPGKPKSGSWLEDMRSLVRLDEEHQRRIHDGELSKADGLLLASIAPAERAAVLADAAQPASFAPGPDGQPVAQGDGGVKPGAVRRAARERGLTPGGMTRLRMPEVSSGWKYLSEHDAEKYPKTAKLAGLVEEWHANRLPEPDFFKAIRKLVG